ncbi:thrombospondin related adhesive [Cryptosporidium xiaoi]|uniref:Thrombospondin related adhesive n=1 Tax=Cryptosporidium xiaoi TaxID=659607 RepID=A0AAV9XT26_9CRYT
MIAIKFLVFATIYLAVIILKGDEIWSSNTFVVALKSRSTSRSTSRSRSRSRSRLESKGVSVPNLGAYSCPEYNTDVKGFACWGMNTAYTVKKGSWQECANQCYWSKRTTLGNCSQFVFNPARGECYIKNNDTKCKKTASGYIYSKRHSYLIGECATTCKVSEWSDWTPCTAGCGEMRSRSRAILSKAIHSNEYCPNLIEYSNCPYSSECPENCPQYGVSILGWGCQYDSTFSYRKNIVTSYQPDWKSCLNDCKQDPLCVTWSFNSTLSEEPNYSTNLQTSVVSSDTYETGIIKYSNRGYRPCYIHRYSSGCHALAPGWISGNKNTLVDKECDTGSCKYTEWTEWTTCLEECSNSETQKRSRTVESITLNWVDVDCTDQEQVRVCSEKESCISSDNNDKCLVNSWSEWSSCSTSCGSGLRTRTREIIKKPGNGDISICPVLLEEVVCNADVKCPGGSEECLLSEWSEWSPCSASCGSGVSTRTRKILSGDTSCDNYSQGGSGNSNGNDGKTNLENGVVINKPLNTLTSETKVCNDIECGDDKAKCLAVFTVWTNWSECSEKCDNGYLRRYRDIDFSNIGVFGYEPPGTKDEQNKVREICKDVETMEEIVCNTGVQCTQGCSYTEWGVWSDCDCSGTQKRERTVTITFPEGISNAICQSNKDVRNCIKPEGCVDSAPDPGDYNLALAIGVPVGLIGIFGVVGSLFLINVRRDRPEEDESNYQYLEEESNDNEDGEYINEIGPDSGNWAS